HVDPDLLSDDEPEGPVRVMDAHPGTEEPAPPRFPCQRYELDDAAYNLGGDENPMGGDGAFRWTVLETDAAGRMKVRVELRGK
ncbi:MAG TPA: hypothetical protein VJ483_06370, partial [Holophagaceae bacterium]|nr:hypothetical protein [Holophagaceae bacterium]